MDGDTSNTPNAASEPDISDSQNASANSSARLKRGVVILLILLAVFTAYSPALSGNFVWDDVQLIQNAPSAHTIMPLREYFAHPFWSEEQGTKTSGYFRPIITLSYSLDWHIWEGNPDGFHLLNILFHLANCLLAFFLARKWGAAFWPSAASMAIFGLLPRLSESVAWISGRTDSLAAFFVLIALLAYPVTPSSPEKSPPLASSRVWGGCLLAAAAIFMGLCCKEVAAAGLAALGTLELTRIARRNDSIRSASGRILCLLPGLAVYAFLRLSAGASSGHGRETSDLLLRIKTILAALGEYLRMSVLFPFPELQIGSTESPRVSMAILGASAVAVLTVLAWKRGFSKILRSDLLPLIAMGGSALALVIHIFPLALRPLAADRFLYVPALAFCISCAILASRKHWDSRSAGAAAALCTAVLILTFIQTQKQAERWCGERQLYTWGCSQASDNFLACILLAGQLTLDGQPEKALQLLRKSSEIELQTSPVYWKYGSKQNTMNITAHAYSFLGKYDIASEILEKNLEKKELFSNEPQLEGAITLYFWAQLALGKIEQTREFLRTMRGHNTSISANKLNEFDLAIQRVEILRNALGEKIQAPPQALSAQEMGVAVQLGNELDDRYRLTQLYLNVLTRDEFPGEAKEEALYFLSEKAICSLLSQANNLPFSMPDRCAPMPAGILE